MSIALQVALVMVTILVILLIIGAPIGVAIGLSSAVSMICMIPANVSFATSAQRIFAGSNSFSLIAIPFFILAGNIMNNGGIATRLVNCAKVIAGRMPGALAQSNVVANMLFGAISGSGAAAAAAMGSTIGPLEEKEGDDKNYSVAVNVASAPVGMLIPPSNTMIVYSSIAGSVSIAALFMAGYIPGIIWGGAVMILAGIMAKKRGYQAEERVTFKIAMKTFWQAIPSLLLIIIVIGGILAGVFTATEGSAIAVVYATVLSLIYKSFKLKDIPRIVLESAKTTGIITFMIGLSSIMSWAMAFTEIPDMSYRQQDTYSSFNKCAVTCSRNIYGCNTGNSYLYTYFTSYMYSIWHEPNTVWYSALLQLINRNNYTSGWNNPLHGLPCWWSYY